MIYNDVDTTRAAILCIYILLVGDLLFEFAFCLFMISFNDWNSVKDVSIVKIAN